MHYTGAPSTTSDNWIGSNYIIQIQLIPYLIPDMWLLVLFELNYCGLFLMLVSGILSYELQLTYILQGSLVPYMSGQTTNIPTYIGTLPLSYILIMGVYKWLWLDIGILHIYILPTCSSPLSVVCAEIYALWSTHITTICITLFCLYASTHK